MYFNLEVGFLGNASYYPATGNPYNSLTSFVGITVMGIFLGFLIGTVEEIFFKHQLKGYPFFLKIFLKTILYLFLIGLLIIVLSFMLNASNMGTSVIDKEVESTVLSFIVSFSFLSTLIFVGVLIALSLFFSEIVDFLGMDVVGSFFTGKYARSVIEDKVFMFLDMKSSTAIAEKLGHEKHYRLINDYYSDMSEAIVQTKGLIYQYVGDEIVIYWNTSDGLGTSGCLRCFFMVQRSINARSQHYQKEYGLVPEFKAGIHYGQVTRGQVGGIKRELLFTGDVLNTTARIQSMCNELNADLLVSSELKNGLVGSEFEFINRGSFSLKGRNKEATLFEVTEK